MNTLARLIVSSFFILSISACSTKESNAAKTQTQHKLPEVIHGYRLPPEPDPKINNSTLLGIDSNNNGVRDDVERWIYETYKEYIPCHQELDYNNTVEIDGKKIPSAVQVCDDHPVPYHPVVREVMMEGARVAQIIIENPTNARATTKLLDNAQNCSFYLSYLSNKNKQKNIDAKDFFNKAFKKIQFNTVERARAFGQYNHYLSGRVYSLPKTSETVNDCSDKIKEMISQIKKDAK